MKELPARWVTLHGKRLAFLENSDGTGPLAPEDHIADDGNLVPWAMNEDSYAHVCSDGTIKRYLAVIGTRADLKESS